MPPPLIEITIDSWESLTRELDQLQGTMPSPCFRGQGDYSWQLCPSINRYLTDVPSEQAARLEFAAVLRFLGEAHEHLPATSLPRDPFGLDVFDNFVEWLALMQHHGAPTRLLDWSFSPYVGLYFAVTGRPSDDAALWFFDQSPIWGAFCTRFQTPPMEFFDYRVLPATLLTAPKTSSPFLFSGIKKMRSAREIAQQGMFTFCDHLQADHQAALEAMAPSACGRIRISAALKPEFTWRLKMMNLTPAALFPGVDGVCQSIRQDFDTYRVVPT